MDLILHSTENEPQSFAQGLRYGPSGSASGVLNYGGGHNALPDYL